MISIIFIGDGRTTDLTNSEQGMKLMVEDLFEFPDHDEIPVTIATNGHDLVFVGTNAALYEFNILTKKVRSILFLVSNYSTRANNGHVF